MATKIQKIMESNPNTGFMFGDWLTRQGLDAKGQHAYMKSGWLNRISKGVYVLSGTAPKLLHAISAYNNQLSKRCILVLTPPSSCVVIPIICHWASHKLIFLPEERISFPHGYCRMIGI